MAFSGSRFQQGLNVLFGVTSVVLMINLAFEYVILKSVVLSRVVALAGVFSGVLLLIALLLYFLRKLELFDRVRSLGLAGLLFAGVYYRHSDHVFLGQLLYSAEALTVLHVIKTLHRGFIYDTSKRHLNVLVTLFFFAIGAFYPYLLWQNIHAGQAPLVSLTCLLAGIVFVVYSLFYRFGEERYSPAFHFYSSANRWCLIADKAVSDLLFVLVFFYSVQGLGEVDVSIYAFGFGVSITIGLCFFIRLLNSQLPVRVFAALNSLSLIDKLPSSFSLLLFLFLPGVIFFMEFSGFSDKFPSFEMAKAILLSAFFSAFFIVRFGVKDIAALGLFPRSVSYRTNYHLLLAVALFAGIAYFTEITALGFVLGYSSLLLIQAFTAWKLVKESRESFKSRESVPDLSKPTHISAIDLARPLTTGTMAEVPSSVLYDLDPYAYENRLFEQLGSSDPSGKLKTIDKVEKMPLFSASQILKEVAGNKAEKGEVRKKAQKALDRFSMASNYLDSNQDFYELIENSHDEYFLKVLARFQEMKKDTLVITKLFNDLYDSVSREAMIMAGYLKEEKLLTNLLKRMDSSQWNSVTKSVIAQYGDSAVWQLNSYFESKEIQYLTKIDLIDILAKIGTENALETIAKKATNYHRDLVMVALGTLERAGYKLKKENRADYGRLLDDFINSYTLLVLLNAYMNKYKNDAPELRVQLNVEIDNTLKCILIILELLYDKDVVEIYYNINTGKGAVISDRLLFDLKYPHILKNKLLPLFNPKSIFKDQIAVGTVSDSSKLEELCFEIIHQDHLQTSPYLKALAIYSLKELNFDIGQLTPLLFSQHRLIWETSAYILAMKDIDTLSIYIGRLGEVKKNILEKIQLEVQTGKDPLRLTVLGVIYQLKKIPFFREVPEITLFKYIDDISIMYLEPNMIMPSSKCQGHYFIVAEGAVEVGASNVEWQLENGEIVEVEAAEGTSALFTSLSENVQLYSISKEVMHQLVPHSHDKQFRALRKIETIQKRAYA